MVNAADNRKPFRVLGLLKVVSGGQTGADRAALEVARKLRLPYGGWCPNGRRTEKGRLPKVYRLVESPSSGYTQRTKWKVRDSDGTLIVNRGALDGGTLLTARLAREGLKPVYIHQIGQRIETGRFRAWLVRHRIRTLNVAGPRESKRPGIQAAASKALARMLRHLGRIHSCKSQ